MKSSMLPAVLCVLILGACRAEEPPRGPVKAVIVPQGPKIDGTLKDPVWEKAPILALGEVTGLGKAAHKTTARVLFDDKFLYVAFDCEEPATGSIKKDITTGDGNVWEDDCVELFISADPEAGYKHIVINPANAIFDQDCPAKGDKNTFWNAKIESKVSTEDGKRWIATLAIPMKDLDAYVGENVTWKMNLTRTRPKRGDDGLEECSWAVLPTSNFHQPDSFAKFTGVTVPEKADGVTRKRDKPAPPPPEAPKTSLGTQDGDITVYFKYEFEDGIGGFGGSDKVKLEAVPEGVSGKGLKISRTAPEGGFGASLALKITGSKDLKMLYHCKASGVPQAGLNVTDTVSKDNTTANGYRWLSKDTWVPVLYYLDNFRYNSKPPSWDSRIRPEAFYSNMFFHGEEKDSKDTWMLLDNFVIYRGSDRTPPSQVKDLKAEAKDTGVQLSWAPATDNAAVMLYAVSRAGADGAFKKIAESFSPAYLDPTAAAGDYKYRVLACDFEENLGAWSENVSAKSTAAIKPPEPTVEEIERENYRENILAIAKKGEGAVNRNVVTCYGDSLTGATSYPLEIQGALLTKRVAAYGYAGMRTDFGKQNAAGNLGKDKPYVALVLYGTNNSKSAEAVKKGMEDMEGIVTIAAEMGIIPILGTIPPRAFTDPESKPEAGYNQALIETCKKMKVPCGHLFEDYQKQPDRKALIAGDGVHNTSAGMSTSARAWKRALDQVGFVLRDKP